MAGRGLEGRELGEEDEREEELEAGARSRDRCDMTTLSRQVNGQMEW